MPLYLEIGSFNVQFISNDQKNRIPQNRKIHSFVNTHSIVKEKGSPLNSEEFKILTGKTKLPFDATSEVFEVSNKTDKLHLNSWRMNKDNVRLRARKLKISR